MSNAQIGVAPDLELGSHDPDTLQQLGSAYLRGGRAHAALRPLLRAGSLTAWQWPELGRSLRRAVAESCRPFRRSLANSEKARAYRSWRDLRNGRSSKAAPLVSIVVPSYNHAAFVDECLTSVYRQTYPNIELVIIDDGSTDASRDVISRSLRNCPFPFQFVSRENRGAHVTINDGISLTRGEFLNVLNSDDRFAPRRIERLVASVAGIGAEWGFTGVEMIDATGRSAARVPGSMADGLAALAASASSAPTVGFALLRSNAAISSGNLFVSRKFHDAIGGFSALRYHHDWEFALRAGLSSEAVHVPEPLYEYRLHGSNTTWEAGSGAQGEGTRMLGNHLDLLLSDTPQINQFAPTYLNWGAALLAFIVEIGFVSFLPIEQVRRMAELLTSGDVAVGDHGPWAGGLLRTGSAEAGSLHR